MPNNEMKSFSFKAPFRIPIKTPLIELEEREVLIVEWVNHDGQSYYGECNAFTTDWYHFETIASVKTELSQWFQKYKHAELIDEVEAFNMLEDLNEFPNARSVMSMIFYQMFNELESITIAYGATINQQIEQYFKQYGKQIPSRIKLKWHDQIHSDIAFLEKEYPHVQIVIDANGMIEDKDISLLNTFNNQNFIYIEQPFKNIESYKAHRSSLKLPIFIDESATSLEQIKQFQHAGLIDGVVIKPSRVGGIDKALAIINYCKEHHLKYVIGGMYEFGLSSYFTAMLAQDSDYPSDITPSDYYFTDDIVEEGSTLEQNKIKYPIPQVNQNKLKKTE
ncbi:o-succinylbenzoate synthase [Mammaliicoccus sp. Dog046]|uniref:o-succinylbenzoate synthase n=1 Tax=Mammaliicoccus sp. Dog046 TaxID=3034233 RepID=UPI002B258FFD|nr:o-succinylbenzoate synthase [Mammaliicoccus sp. Dog046]WQK86348.1 o-succinylbenzoate synthase [Mammaliicoccus sp. Dog046]